MNRLKNSSSPYLLQHQNNPVWWFPWGEEAFQEAQKQNKPIFLSIGYSTCHWCHVMEHDSFTHTDVAEILNESFTSIKVDREEHPDVDAIYMQVVQMISGHGGWPMTVLMMPNGKPFWAGTFVPKPQLKRLLTEVTRIWKSEEKKELVNISEEIAKKLSSKHSVAEQSSGALIPLLEEGEKELIRRHDPRHGGFGHAPKFPPSMSLQFLLQRQKNNLSSSETKDVVKLALDSMLRGGFYDVVGGGFHRYSTDAQWFVPHFEKMLYTNTLLLENYLDGYQVLQNADYLHAATHTVTYLLRDMQNPEGGFYSAEDADSENAEGSFYVWNEEELQQILTPQEFERCAKIFEFLPEGNFEFENHAAQLEKNAGMKTLEKKNIFRLYPQIPFSIVFSEPIQAILAKCLQHREKRKRPHRDEKILTGWNGLAIGALAKYYVTTQDKASLHAAERAVNFIYRECINNKCEIAASWYNGKALWRSTLEDYCYLIYGLYELYLATSQTAYLNRAEKLQHKQNKMFWGEDIKAYYQSPQNDALLIVRPFELMDSAVPNPNALSILNLCRLGESLFKLDWKKRAEEMTQPYVPFLQKYPSASFTFLNSVQHILYPEKQPACYDNFCDVNIKSVTDTINP